MFAFVGGSSVLWLPPFFPAEQKQRAKIAFQAYLPILTNLFA